MVIGICADHAGFPLKEELVSYLKKKGYEVRDFGTNSTASMDYPDVAHPLADAVVGRKVDCGIALCGTGNGMAMSLNHHAGIRAGLAWNKAIAELIKAHNDANVLVMPARFITPAMARLIVRTWLGTAFEGGRHQRRIDKIEPGK
jgi:ribose 5-phosphate isomerase B